jgi:hypothetical protein
LQAFSLQDRNGDYLLDTLFSQVLDEQFNTPAVVYQQRLYIGSGTNRVDRYTFSGIRDSVYYYNRQVDGLTVKSPVELVIQTLNDEDDFYTSPAVIDLNSDGLWDQVAIRGKDRLVLTMGEEEEKEIILPAGFASAPAFGDVDEDGFYEILVNLSDRIYGLYWNGAPVSNFPILPILESDERLIGTPLLFDMDGDGRTDIVTCSSKGQIFAYNLKGKLLPGFPLSAGGRILVSPLVSDYDADDRLELFVLSSTGTMLAWQLEAPVADNKIWWKQSWYDETANNFITELLVPVIPDENELMPAHLAYNYPNPNTGNFTTLRYYLRENAQVDIKIFDLAGDIVEQFSGPGEGRLHNEIRWDLEDISSGVYLGRIEAVSNSGQEVRLIKILVIK